MTESLKYAIEIVDRWGKPLQRFNKDLDKVDRRKLKNPFRDMNKSLDDLNADLKRYKNLQAKSFRSDHVRKYGRMIEITRGKINKLNASTGATIQKTNKLGGVLRSLGGIVAAGMAVRGITRLGKASIDAAAKFEKYTITLKTMLGSQGAARERMAEYTDIAKKTPFQLREVVEAGNKLQAIGRYSRDNLTMLGDLAAASSKPIDQVMNAYSKLAVGEKGEGIRMFRDLLISEKDWQEATGKNIKNLTTDEMMKAMPKLMKKKGFFGMMSEQAKTTEGRVSNLSDSFDMLKVAAGERLKPAFDGVVKSATGLVETVEEWVAIPTEQKIAREKAELNSLVGIITDTNTGEKRRLELLKELKTQYPEFLEKVDLETVKNEQLRKKLVEVNDEYRNKMRLASMKSMAGKGEAELQDLYDRRWELKNYAISISEAEALKTTLQEEFDISGSGSKMATGKGGGFLGALTGSASARTGGASSTSVRGAQEDAKIQINKKYKIMQERLSKDEKDAEAARFVELYNEMEAYQQLAGSYTHNVDAKLKELELKIRAKEKVVGIQKRALDRAEKKQLLKKARSIDITTESNYNRLFGDLKSEEAGKLAIEYENIIGKQFENIEQWGRLSDFVEGKLKYTKNKPTSTTNNNPASGLDLDKASATITGGGRMVKQVNIEFDSLIGENVNQFRDTDSIEDADDFLTKLSNALQSVVNDTNLASV